MHQHHKMVKNTQTIRRLLPTNYLVVFNHFVGLTLKKLLISKDKSRLVKHRSGED